MKLTEIPIGAGGTIKAVPLPRMNELGLVPGTPITILSKGALGNPIEIHFSGCTLLIDHNTAAETEVEPCDSC